MQLITVPFRPPLPLLIPASRFAARFATRGVAVRRSAQRATALWISQLRRRLLPRSGANGNSGSSCRHLGTLVLERTIFPCERHAWSISTAAYHRNYLLVKSRRNYSDQVVSGIQLFWSPAPGRLERDCSAIGAIPVSSCVWLSPAGCQGLLKNHRQQLLPETVSYPQRFPTCG